MMVPGCGSWRILHLDIPLGHESDGISYLDKVDTFWMGDWQQAVKYRSPLCGLLLGLVLRAFHVSPYWGFSVVHSVNFSIYVGALACFDFFLRAFLHYEEPDGITPVSSSACRNGRGSRWAILAIG